MADRPETKREREIRMERFALFEAWRKSIPDSRLRSVRMTRPSPIGEVELLFCMHCGRGGGAVTVNPDRTMVAQFICRPCAETHGGLTVPEVPRELVVAED